MAADLSTTNLFLGVIAVVSALEALGLLVISVGVFVLIRRIVQLINSLETHQIAPAAARVHAILDDMKEMTSTVRSGVGWIDRLTTRIFHY
jgi:hypothetical protein